MVAEVEEEPCAEEARLSGGDAPDGMLSKPSDSRVPPVIDLLSPLPLSRLGVLDPV